MSPDRHALPTSPQGEDASPGFIVGVAASAGCLDALERFFAQVEPGHGLALLVVQHMERDHTSLLPELLAHRNAHLRFRQAESGDPVEADGVYIVAQGTIRAAVASVLKAEPLDDRCN